MDIKRCKFLYEQAFGEDEVDFENKLFSDCLKYLKTFEVDKKIRSMLFLLPATLKTQEKSLNAYYLYAAATEIKSRNKGYMSSLINSLSYDNPIFLKPANEDVIEFYKKLRFKPVNATKRYNPKTRIIPCCEYKDLSKYEKYADENYLLMYRYNKPINLQEISFPFTME